MSACREGFNLFNKYQRANFFRRGLFGDRWARENVFGDTFRFVARWFCKCFGHGKVSWMDWEDGKREQLCHRCLRRTGKTDPYKGVYLTCENILSKLSELKK